MLCLHCQEKDAIIKFCSRSCAAIYNNKLFPKRNRTVKCKSCDNKTRSRRLYCDICISNNKNTRSGLIKVESRTLGVEIERVKNNRSPSNLYTNIRKHAQCQVKNREKKCSKCGYDKHVEVAHKKAINEFDLNTTIGQINSDENLILLCPNCHWEFDNGIIVI